MRLAAQGLLGVCQGDYHPDVQELKLWDLSKLPTVPPDHPQYLRFLEIRMKYERDNDKIETQAKNITLRAWTNITNQIMSSCEESHPALFNDIWALEKLDIGDSGCGTSLGNRPEIFEGLYECKTAIDGAAGAFETKMKGNMRNPMMTDEHGLGLYREDDAILHEACGCGAADSGPRPDSHDDGHLRRGISRIEVS